MRTYSTTPSPTLRVTAAADGAYRFRTIVPVPYPGRTAHIHFRIKGQGFEPLTTQMYLAGQPLNASDFVYRSIADPAARAAVTVARQPASQLDPQSKRAAQRATFHIALGLIT